ncbi:PREDICTED: 28S ribosomal protein S22, mitochondrial-like [Amphimedon queenslandica]|uniref:28S ribosomal protein S22, mitochondrial n=1 Tax=Amphimedon queenslandica TaxID=400682 RepID=A0A1X7VLA8_AMPQE|nr:PREDICTED: 28S ribosomal protein S22, mitochondrial-like [Amphimedon queenslandica]|eukprot:XP_003383895.1 PREDICTED: 28S ribosomal protein S22, mitochondrial-like [Amphimedon queenslandica]
MWAQMATRRLSFLFVRSYCSEGPQSSVRFDDERVQNYISLLNGRDFNKVFSLRKGEASLPKFKLMNREMVKKAYFDTMKRCEERLKPPPVVEQRKDLGEEISTDPKLKDFDDSKWVFTDISMGIEDKDRYIVVREPSGTLRQATAFERDRLCQTYMPAPGRKIWLPTLLTKEELPYALKRVNVLHILDLVCAQCPPDSPDYIRVQETAYEYVRSQGLYSELYSTKHYGGLIWYLVQKDKLLGLIGFLVSKEKLGDVEILVKLYCLVHPDTATESIQELTGEEMVKSFCEHKGYLTILDSLSKENDSSSEPVTATDTV